MTQSKATSRTDVLILGAGFGGLELATRLSESVADLVTVTLIDQSEGFTFGFSKLEVLFGRRSAEQVRHAYTDIDLPGVEFRRERVTSIEPSSRQVETDRSSYRPDILVVALGADYDQAATPGFVEDGYDFYSVGGAERLSSRLATFAGGDIVVAVLGVPFKCPPAPYEAVFLLHDYLVGRGLRDRTHIEVITPMPSPIPVSASASDAITAGLAERDVVYTPGRLVRELDPVKHVAHMTDETRRYDLFVGVPVHRVPEVVAASGLTAGGNDGWVAVDRATLATPYPGVYALGDCADAPVPRAGVFAESAARVVAEQIVATVRGGGSVAPYDGTGVCYLEFGNGAVAKVDSNFLGLPQPLAEFVGPSVDYVAEKAAFAADRRQRWFGGSWQGDRDTRIAAQVTTYDSCGHIEGPFFHGTRSALGVGDELVPGKPSNFQEGRVSNNIYFSALVDTAAWGAELATALAGSEEPGHIYVVEPLGPFEDDPNVTNKKFPGNPTQSYRTRHPLRVVGEVGTWEGHDPEVLKAMLDRLALLREQGLDLIED